MLNLVYPARIREDAPGDFIVSFRDVPEAVTGGDSEEEALANALDALAAAVEGYLRRDRPIPFPSAPQAGEQDVPLDPAVAARAVLAVVMSEQKISNVELGRRIKRDEKAVRRILSGKGASFELTVSALLAVGLVPALSVLHVGPMQFDPDPKTELRWRGAFSRANRVIAEPPSETPAARRPEPVG